MYELMSTQEGGLTFSILCSSKKKFLHVDKIYAFMFISLYITLMLEKYENITSNEINDI